jgi:hypothetical protein
MTRVLVRAWKTAFSTGAGYEPQPPGRFFRVDTVSGYFVDFTAKTLAATASKPGVLEPAALAQLALGWWERHLAGEADARSQFERTSRLLLERGESARGGLHFPYRVRVPKYGLSPPWYSALAQSQAASVLVRFHVLTGDETYANAARQAIEPMLSNEHGNELVRNTIDGPILEEAPSQPPSHILNGWIYGLWGLWEVGLTLGEPRAKAQFHASVGCLRQLLGRYDVGWWTKYSLYPHVLADLAKPFYHELHVNQVKILYELTGFAEFGAAAERWARYDTRARRVAALAQKAAFAMTGR